MNIGDVRVSRGLIGAGLVMFLFPFITVSCGAQSISLTGVQLATGTTVMGERMGPQMDVTLAILAAVMALAATWLHSRIGVQPVKVITAIFAASSFGWLQFFKFREDISVSQAEIPITISYNAGFWLSGLLFFGAAALNVWLFVIARRGVAAFSPTHAAATPAAMANSTLPLETSTMSQDIGEHARE